MLIDDKSAMLRLKDHPEFVLRLDEFLATHNPDGKPALVIQARPANGSTHRLDVADAEVEKRFLAGRANTPNLWNGLASQSRVKRTFHGIASLPKWKDPEWACEAHRDSHFIAGSWQFPELDFKDGKVPCLLDLHGAFFADFVASIQSTLGSQKADLTFDITVTLTGAKLLYFARKDEFTENYSVTGTPLGASYVQFPMVSAQLGSTSWTESVDGLAQALCGLYGAVPLKKR